MNDRLVKLVGVSWLVLFIEYMYIVVSLDVEISVVEVETFSHTLLILKVMHVLIFDKKAVS